VPTGKVGLGTSGSTTPYPEARRALGGVPGAEPQESRGKEGMRGPLIVH
jgi:hypothetical protein